MQVGFHSRGGLSEPPLQRAGHRQGQAGEEESLLPKRPPLGSGAGGVVVLLEVVHPHLRRALGVPEGATGHTETKVACKGTSSKMHQLTHPALLPLSLVFTQARREPAHPSLLEKVLLPSSSRDQTHQAK